MIERATLTSGAAVRRACRSGEFTGQTSGLAPGYAQANLVILPERYAVDFTLFCKQNPKPCPLLERTPAGATALARLAADTDLRTDLPRYRVWEHGQLVDEPTDIRSHWRDDLVSFLIGCSFTFEAALMKAGISVRHVELGVNVPMYRTNISCVPAGPFRGPLVVSMRPLKPEDVERAAEITSRYPRVHGGPVHVGSPQSIGIADISQPDFGDAVPVADGEVPVFWACGVTPQLAIMEARPELAITHSPGCMFVSDVRDEELGGDWPAGALHSL